jgi:hypothetical protein
VAFSSRLQDRCFADFDASPLSIHRANAIQIAKTLITQVRRVMPEVDVLINSMAYQPKKIILILQFFIAERPCKYYISLMCCS